MKISYNWLKQFIDLELSAEKAADKLTLIGLEVEELESVGSTLDGVVVGEVLNVEAHPNADRLFLCRVNLGSKQVQIVCGADNVAKGQKVAAATVGTTLPVTMDDGSRLTLRKAKLRGEESSGMICAEDELGLGSDHDGIMVLDSKLKPGTPLNEVVEVYRDEIIDIAITPNRPDATCHLGVARDLAAALGLELRKPFETKFAEAAPLSEHIDIRIENPEKCHRYAAKLVTGVTIKESPAWMSNLLKALGIRPVNNVVDATNYVLHELGQPLHAFDFGRIRGREIVVRDFSDTVEFETLDHVRRSCAPGTLFICDGDGPVAIAGVMGGVDSEVSRQTTEVLVESAWFEPGNIRKTAKAQSLQTDASYRFERGVDPELQRIAAERCARLIAELSGGSVADGCTDLHPVKTEPKQIVLRKEYVNRLLGTTLSVDEIDQFLCGLELKPLEKTESETRYQVPTFRPDLEREVDLIEEVGRLYDYNNIPAPSHTSFVSPEPLHPHEQHLQKVLETAKNLQFKEIYTNSLMPEKDAGRLGDLDEMIHTLNPISRDMTTLRPTLLYGFLKSAAWNFNRKQPAVRFFEMGNVFQKHAEGTWYKGIMEETHLFMGISGFRQTEHWKTDAQPYDLFDLKASVTRFLEQFELDGRYTASVDEDGRLAYRIGDTLIGHLWTVPSDLLASYEIEHPVYASEFSVTRIKEVLDKLPKRNYEPVSRFPAFDFDIAVVVASDVRAGELMDTIHESAGPTLDSLQVFDVFEGESIGKQKKSLAFRLSFLDKNKTLTINDIEPIINKTVTMLQNRFSAKLRS